MLTMQVIAIMITVIICDFLTGYLTSIILPSDLVKTWLLRMTAANTCALETGWPSLRTCSLRRLMISAICSVLSPPFRSART